MDKRLDYNLRLNLTCTTTNTIPLNLHKTVKLYTLQTRPTSKFEVVALDTVITKAAIGVAMESDNKIINIDEEQNLDRVTAEQLAKIVQFLLNLED
jgi:hypothetical protein